VHQDTVVLDDGIEKRLSYDGRMQFVLDDAVERRLFIMAGCSLYWMMQFRGGCL